MNIGQTASSVAMQVMEQPSSLANGAHASSQRGALALVEAEVATAPQVSSNGMVGSIVNTFA
ncbi:hypothetical protein RI103_03910 [Paraburkholderia sp. FT54]|uniref:hypothetical protein n=1 Tax=Paraburkholderia sp. FT54 TaxID=3074437 RepID=UPI002877E845|nr:hypothetical protein [Paraburkholderia sp. FT54]WNC90520.1 hypothetical protein RI103_03910 [Paraburkholderia sp. FT54]